MSPSPGVAVLPYSHVWAFSIVVPLFVAAFLNVTWPTWVCALFFSVPRNKLVVALASVILKHDWPAFCTCSMLL